MERFGFAIKVNEGKKKDFRTALGKVWKELTVFLDESGIKNFSLWNVQDIVFGYCEIPDPKKLTGEETACVDKLIKEMEHTFTWISTPGQNMCLMYHDYGMVRASKELIRHRVFVTKLKAGCEEEYKRRHDRLIEQRGNRVNPGPDSNFSIFCAGGYIFGYNEIDVTMEQERTQEEINADIAWENKQLEIMDWLTDDVDWITGENHLNIVRLAWHEG